MIKDLSLITIPRDDYKDYRYEVIFRAYKWDPQVADVNTVADHILLISAKTANMLEGLAELLSAETVKIEEALLKNPKAACELGISHKVLRRLKMIKNYHREEHVRLMRFDFHPTEDGWVVSEVNSDVPAGIAEASILPELANPFCKSAAPRGNIANSILKAYSPLIQHCPRVAFVHATAYGEDRQVLQCLGDVFEGHGIEVVYAAPNQLKWAADKAFSIVNNQNKEIGGVVRYFPAEWLAGYGFSYNWAGYFTTRLPSCNHPIALYSQSKRVPLIWESLGFDCPAWKSKLPLTTEPRFTGLNESDWIYKPAMSRVGEGITIKEAISEKEYKKIIKDVKKYPKKWVSQRRFKSLPLLNDRDEEYHLCVGVFTLNGKSAGFYGRASTYPKIDDKAIDIPILVSKE